MTPIEAQIHYTFKDAKVSEEATPMTTKKPRKKVCPKCEEKKSLQLFYKQRSAKDGLQTYCMSCVKTYNLEKKVSEQALEIAAKREIIRGLLDSRYELEKELNEMRSRGFFARLFNRKERSS